jgi:phage/plasmid-like protein (TIGR03299 family)
VATTWGWLKCSARSVAAIAWAFAARPCRRARLSAASIVSMLSFAADRGSGAAASNSQPNVKWETAGVLDGGRAVWCLALLDEPMRLAGDDETITLPYLAITNRHDGSGACALRATAVRIVCMNTFRAAELEGDRTGTTFAFRHSKRWRDRIDDARLAVTGARREFEAYRKLATELLGIPVTSTQRETFVQAFIPAPPVGLATDRVLDNVAKARGVLRTILGSQTTVSVAHTAYGLVQAAGEYLDYARTHRTWETRLNRTLIRPEPGKQRALNLALEVARA